MVSKLFNTRSDHATPPTTHPHILLPLLHHALLPPPPPTPTPRLFTFLLMSVGDLVPVPAVTSYMHQLIHKVESTDDVIPTGVDGVGWGGICNLVFYAQSTSAVVSGRGGGGERSGVGLGGGGVPIPMIEKCILLQRFPPPPPRPLSLSLLQTTE